MLEIHQDGYDGQNIWIDFRDLKISDTYPATITTAGDRRIQRGDAYHFTRQDLCRIADGEFRILQYTQEGMGRIIYRDNGEMTTYDLPPEYGFFITERQEFEFFTPNRCDWSYLYIGLKGEFADRVFERILERGPVHRIPRASGAIAELHRLFRHGLQRSMTACELKKSAAAILLELQAEICEPHTGPDNHFLREMTEWTQTHLRDASVSELARHYGFSEKYFQAVFKQRCGVTPGAFLLNQRMGYAKRLLECTEMKLAGIAELAGFTDASHLCRCFRRSFGVTPDSYRNGRRNDDPPETPLA